MRDSPERKSWSLPEWRTRNNEFEKSGKGIVRKGKRPSVYRIGFNDGDETELTANGINELEELWRSLCPEFECEPDSVNYVERVGYEEED